MTGGGDSGSSGQVATTPTSLGNEDLLNMLRCRWDDGAFSDIRINIFDKDYPLHRMVLCRSPFFDRLLQGDWKETNKQVLHLEIPEPNVTCDAFENALAHMYARTVNLDKDNALQVLAAACYLDLQELCIACADFIIDDMRNPDHFLDYYHASKDLEYGPHSDRIQKAGWRHLCMLGSDHLRTIAPQLEIATLKKLLSTDELWVRTEYERYQLIKDTLFPKFFDARTACIERGGEGGMPMWSSPSLGSPRDPWVMCETSEKLREKAGSRADAPGVSIHNHLLDSVEIKDEANVSNHPQPTNPTQNGAVDCPMTEAAELMSLDSARDPEHSGPNTEEFSIHETILEVKGECSEHSEAVAAALKTDDSDLKKEDGEGEYSILEAPEEDSSHDGRSSEVLDIFQAVSDVLGLEGVKYSHIQHADLAKIEIELHEMGLNRAHHALLQGMRTQDILYKRIAVCASQEQLNPTQPLPTARSAQVPRNLHPYTKDDLQELYSRWWLPSFRFGVEFPAIKEIKPQTEQISEAHYYAGSVWKVRLLIDDQKNEVRLHLFRNKKSVPEVGGIPMCYDPREVVCTRFKFLVPGRDEVAARSSRPGRFQQKKGRGWNDFLRLDTIDSFLTPDGNLRVIVIVYPPFETD
ncbi:hypothetical protein BSKO_12236 [Bryopsis sp. KO-2023]|nr:hypothetical protein BSKO_12236 [Bryopsis sp. KO-2023]